tara:strand:- start:271 stop:384 length:114 start_codon:yes stop_codon:yes gene_type:complete
MEEYIQDFVADESRIYFSSLYEKLAKGVFEDDEGKCR